MNKLFNQKKSIIGMIHVNALPGTPKFSGKMSQIIARAKTEAQIYQAAGIDALAIENMHDVPYLKQKVGPEIIAAMSVIAYEVKNTTNLPCGIQILAGANMEALAVAQAANLDFIRVEGFVFAHIADEGFIDGCAADLLRYRRNLGADNVLVFTDVKKKHSSHAVTADVDVIETARAAEFFLSDGVIITGTVTGQEANFADVQNVKAAVGIPVLVGSGITLENVDRYLAAADGLIVGSYFKGNGYWANDLDPQRVERFMQKVQRLRS